MFFGNRITEFQKDLRRHLAPVFSTQSSFNKFSIVCPLLRFLSLLQPVKIFWTPLLHWLSASAIQIISSLILWIKC